jgi:hypothetical protein
MKSAKNNSAELSIVVTKYETLRSAAFGEALPPEARAGLMLFLRRGMWGWVRATTSLSTFEQPTGSRPSTNWKAPEEYRTVIHLFAAMAIRTTVSGAIP